MPSGTRSPKFVPIVANDLQDVVRQLTSYLQEKPLATFALLTLALAVGAGTNSVGRRGSRKAVPRAKAVPVPAPVQRRSRRRKGLGVAAFELDQKGPDGRRTGIDFTWTGPKAKPEPEPGEPESVRREARVALALFKLSHSKPGGKDTAIKFAWSKEPLDPIAAK